MGRHLRRTRAASGLLVVAVIAVASAGGQARATPSPTITSISTYGAQGYLYSSSNWALNVPSNHSNDATVPVDFETSPGDAKLALNSGAFFTSGQVQNLAPNTGWALHVCPSSAATSTDPGCALYGFSLHKTATNDDGVISLTTSPVAIAYDSGTFDYDIRVSGSTDHLDVAVQPYDTQASTTIAGVAGTSRSVDLQPLGTTTDIPVAITSADTTTHQTYTIHVSRGNSDAALSSLTISPGTLSPGFAAGTLAYTASVPSSTSTVAVTPTNENGGTSVVSVDGDPVADASAIPLSDTNPTHIVITSSAEDPNSTPDDVYTIDVTRLASEGLTVATGGTGSGTVTSTAPDEAIVCASGSSTGCTASYDEGTSVTLHEEPATGSIFTGWEGDCSGSDADTTFDMPSSAATCTADFATLGAAQTKSPFTVNLTNDENDGGCWVSRCTLRAALAAAASAGGTIVSTVGDVDLAAPIAYGAAKSLTIDGGEGLTINGYGLSLEDGTFTLKNVTLNDADGTGLTFGGSKLTLAGVTIQGASNGSGCGGLEVDGGTATLTDTEIVDNGGIGGGICILAGEVDMTGGLIASNEALDGGGVLDEGTFVANGVSFLGNDALDGGAAFIANEDGTATITNSTFAYNSDNWTIENDGDGAVSLVSTTVGENEGGLAGNVTLLNTIVGNSTAAPDCFDPVTSLGHNVDSDGSCGLAQTGDRSGAGDILFDDLTPDLTLPLLNGSPALDAGTKTGAGGLTVPTKDAVGTARPQGGAVDVGAMEMPEHTLTIKTVGTGTVETDAPATPAAGLTSPSGWFVAGSTVHLTATPGDGGPAFGSWSGACAGTSTGVDVTMSADETCTATFIDPPAIGTFTPSHGRIGSTVTITGTHLDNVTEVDFGTAAATIKSATSSKLTVVVPSDIGTSPVAISATNAAGTVDSGSNLFTPDWPTPSITRISPTTAAAGATVTITGRNLLGVTAVTFTGGATADITGTSTDTTVKVIVPDDAETGELSLTTPGGEVDSPTFTFLAPPSITSFAPESARFGDTITITGEHLASTTGVAINGVTVKPSTPPTDTQVTVVVPTTASAGSLPLVVFNDGGSTPTVDNFTLDWWTPVVTGVSPASARPGQKITITGRHLTRATWVEFEDAVGTQSFTVVSDTTITATVPDTVGTDPVKLWVIAGDGHTASDRDSDDVVFTPAWPQPKVSSFTPTSGKAGTTVTISGSDFAGVTGVTFNGHAATITGTPTDTKLTVTVPDDVGASGLFEVKSEGARSYGL
jgi:hypothetical protein